MRVIATAGHVDHGKSTLVRALTGMEPDRWAEERRRGLTIDLGFAWCTLPGGRVAFVDVPGHARFVPNMLAGVGEVPAVLFVVAADGGWMPQSTEHLAALDALGVRHGLLAVTRADLADPRPVMADALRRMEGTSLRDVRGIAVSAQDGSGMTELRAALDDLAPPEPDATADVRLWVDRAFTVRGAGTVVTGTLPAGTIRVGDELELAATGRRVRVRGLHTLGEAVTEASGIARLAVNLRGVPAETVHRGDALLRPDSWRGTTEIDVVLRGSPPEELPGQLVLHVGSAAVTVRPRLLGDRFARLRLEHPLPLRVGDPALLRDPGRHLVVAGIEVLDIAVPVPRRRGAARRRAADLAGLVTAERGVSRQAASELLLRRNGIVGESEFVVAGLPVLGATVGERWRAAQEAWAALRARAPKIVRRWRSANPLQPGMPAEELRRELDVPTGVLPELLRDNGLTLADGRVRPADAKADLPSEVDKAVGRLEADLAADPFAAPNADRLAELGLNAKALAAAVRVGRLVKLADGVVVLPDAPRKAADILADVAQPFTLSEARQALGTTRRVAVPLLELLDRKGITERLPDSSRRLR